MLNNSEDTDFKILQESLEENFETFKNDLVVGLTSAFGQVITGILLKDYLDRKMPDSSIEEKQTCVAELFNESADLMRDQFCKMTLAQIGITDIKETGNDTQNFIINHTQKAFNEALAIVMDTQKRTIQSLYTINS